MPAIRTTLLAAALGSLAAVGLLFSSPATARPGPPPGDFEPTAEMKAVRSLKKQIAAEELALALDLTPDQKAALSTLIEGVLDAREEAREARSEGASDLEPLLDRYLAEVRASGEPSAATVEALQQHRGAMKEGREDKLEARKAVKEQLATLLTEEQREALATFRPMQAVGPDPERKEARERRRGERRERAQELADDHGVDDDTMRSMRKRTMKRHARGKAKKNVKGILMSPEMLDVLSR